MRFFVYLLECKDGSYYCGYTNNLQARLKKHNAGKASKYTRSRLPVTLVYSKRYKTKSSAMKREIEIKKMKRNQKAHLIASKTQD